MSSITTKTVQRTTNKKTNTSQRNRRRRQRQKNRRKQGRKDLALDTKVRIEQCTVDYARAVTNPFGVRNTLPCIPDMLTIPSNKFSAKARGVFSTGTEGVGFVSFNPWLMLINNGGNSASATSYPVVFTTSQYAGIEFDPTVTSGAFETGVNGANSNSPYNSSFFNSNARQFRLVAAGIKVTYAGSNFRNQGRLILYKQQGNTDIITGADSSDLLEDNYTTIVPVSRKPEYVFYTPDSYYLNSYYAFQAFDPNVGGSTSRRSLMIYIDGGDQEVPQSWTFEAISYFEAIGPSLTLSKSHSDPQGMGDVIESLPVRNPTSNPKVVENTVLSRLVQLAKDKASQYGPTLLRLGTAMASRAIMGQSPVMNSFVSIEDVD